MKPITIKPATKLRGTVKLPGDKSISHRAAICATLSKGKTEIRNFLFSDDCLVTLRALSALGIKIISDKKRNRMIINSCGFLKKASTGLFMGESGTSARIFLGLLAGQPFMSKITAASSLLKRPMARVIEPLAAMGAVIHARKKGTDIFLPAEVFSSELKGIEWTQKVPSAQVKSAILFAGLFAKGQTRVKENLPTRDHTERMLKLFGAEIRVTKHEVIINKSIVTSPGKIIIPGDISSALFFIVAALLIKGSRVLVKDVGINPTRIGALGVLKRMGAKINILNKRNFYEPVADVGVEASCLSGVHICQKDIPSMIDELPILMVAAAFAKGRTVIEGAGELRVKETDRINSMCSNLTQMGASIQVKCLKGKECIEIHAEKKLKGGHFKSFGDHRTAMSMYVASSASGETSKLDDIECINKSFPEFVSIFRQLFAR